MNNDTRTSKQSQETLTGTDKSETEIVDKERRAALLKK